MPVIEQKNIDTVAVVDDNKDARETLSEELTDARFTPVVMNGPFVNLDALLNAVVNHVDAAVLDHHLNQRNYAGCTGAQAVERLYRHQMPAVLVTSWSDVDLVQIRPYRRWIPALIPRDRADPDSISRGFEMCIREYGGRFTSIRKAWRTVVRVEEVRAAQRTVYCVIPAWSPDKVVSFLIDQVPQPVQGKLHEDYRLFARVNIGAESADQLYLDEFEEGV